MESPDRGQPSVPITPDRSTWSRLRRFVSKFKPDRQASPPTITPVSSDYISEVRKTPEEIKAEISEDLVRLVEMQERQLTASSKLGRPYHGRYLTDPNLWHRECYDKQTDTHTMSLEEHHRKVVGEASIEPVKKASAEVIQKMAGAQEILGNFCKVITDGDDIGIVLTNPFPRTIRRRVFPYENGYYNTNSESLRNPNEKNFLYGVLEDARDVFFVSPIGVGRLVTPIERTYDVPDGAYGRHPWLEKYLDDTKRYFSQHTEDSQRAWFGLLNDNQEVFDRKEDRARTIANSVKGVVTETHGYIGESSLTQDANIISGFDFLGHIPSTRVKEGREIKEAFESSVKAAKEKAPSHDAYPLGFPK